MAWLVDKSATAFEREQPENGRGLGLPQNKYPVVNSRGSSVNELEEGFSSKLNLEDEVKSCREQGWRGACDGNAEMQEVKAKREEGETGGGRGGDHTTT